MSGADSARTAAADSLEDYAFRYVPRSFRRWSVGSVAGTALGSIAFLADFSIGATVGIQHGTMNAVLGIGLASVIIFCIGLPIGYYAARYNLDLDLIARGTGFGYYGSVIPTMILAGFTALFFAVEGAIMAQGLQVGLGIPMPVGYLLSTLVVIPIVIYGMRALQRLQAWTTPLWLVLAVLPFALIVISDNAILGEFLSFGGAGDPDVTIRAVVASAAVCFALTPQLAEQVDYIRTMPPRTPANARRWWAAVILAGPGWVIFSGLKQVLGVLLAVYVLTRLDPSLSNRATEPAVQFIGVYAELMPQWLAITLALVLIVVAQVKINVTNAYSGSLAWLNVYTRVTRTYPGRTIFVCFNCAIAFVLMLADVFTLLNFVLSLYANVVMAWLVTVATDIVVSKYLLKLSPTYPEFRRGMLYSWNPVGVVAVCGASALSLATFFGAFGEGPQPYSVLIAIATAIVLTPLMAILTRGRWYLRRYSDGIAEPFFDEYGNPSAARLRCHVTGYLFERPDMLASGRAAADGSTQYVSSLALTLADSEEELPPRTVPGRERRADVS